MPPSYFSLLGVVTVFSERFGETDELFCLISVDFSNDNDLYSCVLQLCCLHLIDTWDRKQTFILTIWTSPTRYCSSISLASVEWPTSSKLSVASEPACSSKTSSPPGCWNRVGYSWANSFSFLSHAHSDTVHVYTWLSLKAMKTSHLKSHAHQTKL